MFRGQYGKPCNKYPPKSGMFCLLHETISLLRTTKSHGKNNCTTVLDSGRQKRSKKLVTVHSFQQALPPTEEGFLFPFTYRGGFFVPVHLPRRVFCSRSPTEEGFLFPFIRRPHPIMYNDPFIRYSWALIYSPIRTFIASRPHPII